MHRLSVVPPARIAGVVVALAGAAAGVTTVGIAKATLAESAPSAPPTTLEAAHLPPLLTLPGEGIELEYEAFCVPAEAVDDGGGEAPCDVSGAVFVRSEPGGEFSELPLAPSTTGRAGHLGVDVPEALASSGGGFSYFAVLRAPGASPLTLPSGGATAPHVSLPLASAVHVDLGRHAFGALRRADERVASVRWGSGAIDAGLEQGRTTEPIGASAFDVDAAGAVHLLDEVHRRVLSWGPGARRPARIPISITGTLADMTVAPDGSIYVLESVGHAGGTPLVRRFDEHGRELEAVGTAERTASQVRMGPRGPVVLQQPAHQWMPMTADGAPAPAHAQRRDGRVGRPLPAGGEVVVLRRGGEIRVALVGPRGLRHAWRVTSATDIAEVQLAEPVGNGLVVVARVYTDVRDEFLVFLLDRRGLVHRFAVDTADWAETAPLGRFKLVGSSLYRLGSTPAGAFVDRFDLEVR
jgi:hypothetical protein